MTEPVLQLEPLALAVAAGAGRDEAVRAALVAVRGAASADWAVVHLLDGGELIARGMLGPDGEPAWDERRGQPFPGGTTAEVVATGRPVLVPDEAARATVRPNLWARGVRSSAHVPVLLDGRVVGTLNAEWRAPGGCTDERVRALEVLAAHLAVAIGHLRQRAEIERRLRAQEALLEAARIVAAAEDDLDGTLDALVGQARRLLGADAVAVNLADPETGELVVRRPNPIAAPGASAAQPGARFVPIGVSRAAIAAGHPIFIADYQHDRLVRPTYKVQFSSVVATMAVPLLAAGELVGVAYVDWTSAHRASDEELALAEAFARHAAVAVRSARLLAEARRARGELEAVFDAVTQAVIVFAPDGEVLHANASARLLLARLAQGRPISVDLLRGLEVVDGVEGTAGLVEGALAGRTVAAELLWRPEGEAARRLQAVATPVRDADGRIVAGVVACNDVTALHDAIAERARLDGAIKTVRRVAHDLGNTLALVVGYGELVPELEDPGAARMVAMMARGATGAAAKLARLQRIARFAEIDTGGGPMLDLDVAVDPEPAEAN